MPGVTARVKDVFPFIAVLVIVLIVSSILGSRREDVLEAGGSLLFAVFFLHISGFILGYIISRILSDEKTARTISVEVGMQNSGLGVVLARNNFADPLTAIPSAISSIMHSVIGSIAAWIWRRMPSSR
jgi:BASS family bile acid:Na+ symporter